MSIVNDGAERAFRISGGLGTMRRLVAESLPALTRKTIPVWERHGGTEEYVIVESVESLGDGEVVSIKTDIGTYIAEGFLSRNCDTMYAVDPQHRDEWARLTVEEILGEVQRLSKNRPLLVSLSGGNPALQPLGELIDKGHALGYTFALETQGSFAPKPTDGQTASWFHALDYLTISPKPPSSGEETNWEKLDECVAAASSKGSGASGAGDVGRSPQINFKVVVFDETDYEYARAVYARYGERYPFSLSIGTPRQDAPPLMFEHDEMMAQLMTARLRQQIAERFIWLTERVAEDGWFDARVLPQLHVLMWGAKRGV